jgi:predicted flavoprotein YhiN
MEAARKVTLNVYPGETQESLEKSFLGYGTQFARRGVRAWLGAALPERIADILTAESGLGGAAMSQIPRERRLALVRALLTRDIGVTGTLALS